MIRETREQHVSARALGAGPLRYASVGRRTFVETKATTLMHPTISHTTVQLEVATENTKHPAVVNLIIWHQRDYLEGKPA